MNAHAVHFSLDSESSAAHRNGYISTDAELRGRCPTAARRREAQGAAAVASTRATHAAGREKCDQADYRPIHTTERGLGKELIRSLDICLLFHCRAKF
jgi:hypothetical protein